MKKLGIFVLAAISTSNALAANLIINNQVLSSTDPTYQRAFADGSGLSGAGNGVNYRTYDFYVTVSGTYDAEMGVRTGNTAWDTFAFIYSPSLTPSNALLNYVAGNDDTGVAMTVLTVESYFTGTSGRSRMVGVNLIAGQQYQFVATAFDPTQTGIFDIGIGNGQGDVIAGAVPEPATMTVLGLAALAAARRRKQK